jgi:hypothetical protein
MSTSGTVGQTVITVQNLIDSGARRAGKLAEELTDEQMLASKQSLYYILSNLVNIGIQYWCINKVIVGLIPDQQYYYLPVGTVDVLNANYRTLTAVNTGAYSSSGTTLNAFNGVGNLICQLTSNTGVIGINNGSGNPVMINTIGMLPAMSGSVTVNIQYSQDNTTWTTLYSPGATTWAAGTWIYYDLQPTVSAPYWRIQQTSGANMGFYQVVFGTMPLAINMARMNRDDYSSLPNRSFTALRPLQYWFNRTIPQPNMELWPVPNSIQPQLELWVSRQVQDVGALSGEIEIPQRWYLAVQNMLAHQMAMELPQVDPGRIQYCEQQADKYWAQAEAEERDKSPIYFAPNISYYTR